MAVRRKKQDGLLFSCCLYLINEEQRGKKEEYFKIAVSILDVWPTSFSLVYVYF